MGVNWSRVHTLYSVCVFAFANMQLCILFYTKNFYMCLHDGLEFTLHFMHAEYRVS